MKVGSYIYTNSYAPADTNQLWVKPMSNGEATLYIFVDGKWAPTGGVGESAYEAAVKAGFNGSKEEWLDSLALKYSDLTAEQKADLVKDAVSAAERAAQAVENIENAINDIDVSSTDGAITALVAKQGALENKVDVLGPKLGEESNVPLAIELGVISENTGNNSVSSTRLRTTGYINYPTIRVEITSGKYYVFGYNGNGFLGDLTPGWKTSPATISLSEATKYRLCFSKSDNSTITISDFSALGVNVYGIDSSKKTVVLTREIVNDLASGGSNVPASAETVKTLNQEIVGLSIAADNTTEGLSTIQSGAIYTSGNLTSSSANSRWFVTNDNYKRIEVNGYVSTSFAQIAFYNSNVPSSDTLIASYDGTSSLKTYTIDVPTNCVLIGICCNNSYIDDYFYYKLYARDLKNVSLIKGTLNSLQTQTTNSKIAYNENSFTNESGTILVNGNRSSSAAVVRWFIRNDNFKHINVYARLATTHACLAFYNSDEPSSESLIASYAGTSSFHTYSYDIPANCVLIGVATQVSSLSGDIVFSMNIYLNNLVPITYQIKKINSDLSFKIGDSDNIVSLNSPLDMERKLHHISKNKSVLTLAHFSDIHDDKDNLLRFIEFRDKYNEYITDSICTGDLSWNLYTDTSGHPTFSDFWDEVEGTANILVTIGNHETALTANSWSSADAVDVYNKFIKRCVENPNNNVIHEGTKNYYYKDYASKGIRLIVLDPYYDLENQNVWLQSVLADAKTNGLSVICAEHNPFSIPDFIDCSFSAARYLFGGDEIQTGWGNMIASFVQSVDSFQTEGGDFICWIAGHTHCDIVSVNHSYPNQLMISVGGATHEQSTYNSDYRIVGTKSQDNFNLYSFDVSYKTITILKVGQDIDSYMRHKGSMCIRYDTKDVVWND